MLKSKKEITLSDLEREMRESFMRLDTLIQALNKELRDHVLTARREIQELKTKLSRKK